MWNYFTDNEIEEEKEIVSSPISTTQTILDDTDEDEDDEESQ
jgi:hypothetical protein